MLYNLFENRDFVSVFAVALLAEGVDRNFIILCIVKKLYASPSSRRAWIEIYAGCYRAAGSQVALLAEGVDRNDDDSDASVFFARGRPPRGGRG